METEISFTKKDSSSEGIQNEKNYNGDCLEALAFQDI